MFLNLPREIQEAVYDKLEIRDRVTLNIALPKTHTIKKTTRTDSVKDKRLGIAWYYFKKRKPSVVPRYINELLLRYHDDPTAQDILNGLKQQQQNNISTTTNTQDAMVKQMSALTQLESDIVGKTVDASRVHLYPCVPLDTTAKQRLLEAVATHSTPAILDKMIGIPVTHGILLAIFSQTHSLFTIINQGTKELMKHILAKQKALGITSAQLEYVPQTLKLFCRLAPIKTIMEHFVVSVDIKKKALEYYIEMCWFDCAEYMMRECGVRL
jgi:hypothetical protein